MRSPRTKTFTEAKSGADRSDPEPTPGMLVLFSEGAVPNPGGLYLARPETTIGRDVSQHIFIDDPNMSRRHASLILDGDRGMRIRDEKSHNGTHVNGARIKEARVVPGDIVRCGSTLLMPLSDAHPYEGWPDFAEKGPFLGGPAMERIRSRIAALAPMTIDVLVLGESGTGKDVVARRLHELSGRSGPLVAVNCSALPEALCEAEFFGARKGAFTGATGNRTGLMQAAQGGTLFLDEIGDLPLAMQPKILRAVEQREVRPVGASQNVYLDVRIIAATNKNLSRAVQSARFREDLFHRLRAATVELLPLRERREDVLIFARQALRTSPQGPSFGMSSLFVERLLLASWPGNVRELNHALQEAMVNATVEGTHLLLQVTHLPAGVEAGEEKEAAFGRVCEALRRCRGNVNEAAADLRISRGQIYSMLKVRGLSASDFR